MAPNLRGESKDPSSGDEGYSLAAIADKVKCSRSCVSKTLLRVKETGTLKDRKRSGRP